MDRPARVLSVDLLRGADVWLMLFVNEMAGVHGTPSFLLHKPSTADGMTITDVVFPAFLFITGMAVPLALGGRLRRGEPRSSVWRHVLGRTGILLVLGVLMVNAEYAAPQGVMPAPLWNVLMTVAVVLVWGQAGGAQDARWRSVARAAGLVLLMVVALTYRGEGASGVFQMRPHWWGILGLIGWAYLVAAASYLLAGDRPGVLVGITALLYLLCLADEASAIPALVAVRPVVWVGRALGSHGALAVSGAVLTLMLTAGRRQARPDRAFVPAALGYAAALAAAGLLVHSLRDMHPAFWISKVRATAAWCLLSAAWTAAAWAGLFALADVAGWRRWPRALALAGQNALMIYLLAPLLLSVFSLVEIAGGTNPYYALGAGSLVLGTARAILFSALVVWLSARMHAGGLRLQL
jgi:predicted acyltransferase